MSNENDRKVESLAYAMGLVAANTVEFDEATFIAAYESYMNASVNRDLGVEPQDALNNLANGMSRILDAVSKYHGVPVDQLVQV